MFNHIIPRGSAAAGARDATFGSPEHGVGGSPAGSRQQVHSYGRTTGTHFSSYIAFSSQAKTALEADVAELNAHIAQLVAEKAAAPERLAITREYYIVIMLHLMSCRVF